MKKLNQFTEFNLEKFLKEKRMKCLSFKSWDDRDTGTHCGTNLELVIIQDNTDYQTKPDEFVTNLYEKFFVKVPKDMEVPIGAEVKLVEASATVYGEFRDKLSVRAKDVVIVTK